MNEKGNQSEKKNNLQRSRKKKMKEKQTQNKKSE